MNAVPGRPGTVVAEPTIRPAAARRADGAGDGRPSEPVTAPGPATASEREAAAASARPTPPPEQVLPEAAPDGRLAAARLEDVPDHGMVAVTLGRRPVLLCRFGDEVFAVGAACTHQGAPLDDGRLLGALVRCPWHGVLYDVRSGARVSAPSCPDLRTYQVEVTDGTVWVTVDAEPGRR